ncbi:MAG: hypothetical protein Tsb009_31960 [Planctomycetaceae bacterium]
MAQAAISGKRARAGQRGASKKKPKTPVLKTTRYDLASAFMIAIVISLVILLIWVTALWLANRRIKTDNDVPIEIVQLGGVEDGAPDETLKVESPEDPTDDPSLVDAPEVETQFQETIENVVELSDNAAQQVPQQTDVAPESGGKLGSKEGTGRRPLGSGPGEGGTPPYLRWFIRFSEKGTLDVYAQQLDHFGIELGLLKDRKIELLSNLSANKATHRTLLSGKEKANQMYFTWAGGGRKKADVEMFRVKAGIDARSGIIMHFYPESTVQTLLRLESKEAAKAGKTVAQIKRTYFVVRKSGNGYEFLVTRINYR